MDWKKITNETPIVFESGDWDGLRSDFVLVRDIYADYHIARMYEGFMDGSKFENFYDTNDFEIETVVQWCYIIDPLL